ncbi:MAG: DUF2953 domain-containing protein [Clostridiales bacterium]|nr:DUF2953 domain-containing protein [Clostridiales bacterium]
MKRIRISWGLFYFTIYPFKKAKTKKSEERLQKAVQKPPQKKREPYFELTSVRKLLRFLQRTNRLLLRKIVFERFDFSITIASDDPAETGILYGGASVMIGMLLPLFDNTFNVIERSISANVDFSAKKPSLFLEAVLFVRPIQLMIISLVLITHLPIKKRKKDKAVSYS